MTIDLLMQAGGAHKAAYKELQHLRNAGVVETVFPREEHGNWLSNTITQTEWVASMYLGMYIFTIYIYIHYMNTLYA